MPGRGRTCQQDLAYFPALAVHKNQQKENKHVKSSVPLAKSHAQSDLATTGATWPWPDITIIARQIFATLSPRKSGSVLLCVSVCVKEWCLFVTVCGCGLDEKRVREIIQRSLQKEGTSGSSGTFRQIPNVIFIPLLHANSWDWKLPHVQVFTAMNFIMCIMNFIKAFINQH